jgi:hypothetical protein
VSRLLLENVDLAHGVQFTVQSKDGNRRPVSVRVGSGNTWLDACRFPHTFDSSGESLGSDLADEAVRQRAAEELIRLQSAVRELRCAA